MKGMLSAYPRGHPPQEYVPVFLYLKIILVALNFMIIGCYASARFIFAVRSLIYLSKIDMILPSQFFCVKLDV